MIWPKASISLTLIEEEDVTRLLKWELLVELAQVNDGKIVKLGHRRKRCLSTTSSNIIRNTAVDTIGVQKG